MDLKRTGIFIAERRKQKGLTQVKLAEILCVSEKTISKWECGNGFPDTSLMLPLCKVLDITANELLSAKLLYDKEYKEEAESNLLLLKAEQDRNAKFLLTIEFTLGYIVTVLCLALIFIGGMANITRWLAITMIIGGVVILQFTCAFLLRIEQRAGYYECKYCQHKYVPSYKSILLSMHYGTTRYMRCPNCNKRSWQKKVIRKE